MRYALLLSAAVAFGGCGNGHGETKGHDHKHDAKPAADGKVKDPVCGMMIAKGDRKADFDKADWYF